MADSEVKITIAINDRTRGSLKRVTTEAEKLAAAIRKAGAAANDTAAVGQNFTRVGRAAAAARIRVQGFFRSLRANAAASIVQLQALRSGFNRLRLSAAGLGAGFTAIGLGAGLIAASDAANQANARIRIVSETEEDLIRIRGALLEISNETRTSFQENAKVFARLSIATEELGTSESTLLGIIQGVNKAVLLSGATAQEANAGIIQLTQGIASNRFQGDELRSVLENLVVVGDSLAKSLGTTIGGLRELGEAGDLTREKLIPALAQINDLVEERFKRLPVTVGQAVIRIQNTLLTAFTGFETAPLIDALEDLEAELRKPEVQAQLQSLARSASIVAAGFVRAAPAIAGFISNLRILGQIVGVVGGLIIQIAKVTAGNIFGVALAVLRGDLQDAFKIAKDSIDAIFEEELRSQEEAATEAAKHAQLVADIERGKQANLTASSEAGSKARKKIAREETRVIASELRKQVKLAEELNKELAELQDPKTTGDRGGDSFEKTLARASDLREAGRLAQGGDTGQLKNARELAQNLLKEADGIDNVIERTNLKNRAQEILIATDKALLEITNEKIASLEREKKLSEAIAAGEGPGIRFDEPEDPLEAFGGEGAEEKIKEINGTIALGLAELRQMQAEATQLAGTPVLVEVQSNVEEVNIPFAVFNALLFNVPQLVANAVAAFKTLDFPSIPTAAVPGGGRDGGRVSTVGIRGATGGRIPGFGGGDKVPAMLEKGEYIINKQSTRRHLGLLAAINRGNLSMSRLSRLPRFAAGGAVGASFNPARSATGSPVNITLPGGPTLQLATGVDSIESIKRTIANEALKRGRRIT